MRPRTRCLLVEWPERAGADAWPEALSLSLDFAGTSDRILTAEGAPVMGRAMASTMIPPAHAPDFLAACGWGGAQILPLAGDASFRRYFRVVEGERTRGADGRAAAARGSAAVRRRRRMACFDAA